MTLTLCLLCPVVVSLPLFPPLSLPVHRCPRIWCCVSSSVQLLVLLTCSMFCCCFCCSVLFSLHFPLCPTGQGRWPSSLSLVLLEVSSVKGSFSSPLLPMACSRGNCWVFSTCLYSLDFIM
ncbi:hypothetical protein Q5P01_009030 [Channa striata]|uniref:Uncharacterized protein n=1 Tax=Channa striata TaxID=64152 RepID=A0AA88SS69_CHASR|nr:hypothetical protein Q5P01_009030 [Channa striata]